MTRATPETLPVAAVDLPIGTRLIPLWLFVAKMQNAVMEPKRAEACYAFDAKSRMIKVRTLAGDNERWQDVGELPTGLDCATVDFIHEEEDFVGDSEAIAELRRRQEAFDEANEALRKILCA